MGYCKIFLGSRGRCHWGISTIGAREEGFGVGEEEASMLFPFSISMTMVRAALLCSLRSEPNNSFLRDTSCRMLDLMFDYTCETLVVSSLRKPSPYSLQFGVMRLRYSTSAISPRPPFGSPWRHISGGFAIYWVSANRFSVTMSWRWTMLAYASSISSQWLWLSCCVPKPSRPWCA